MKLILASAIILLFSTGAPAQENIFGDAEAVSMGGGNTFKVRYFPKAKAWLIEKTYQVDRWHRTFPTETKLTPVRNFATCVRLAEAVNGPVAGSDKVPKITAECVRAVPEGK